MSDGAAKMVDETQSEIDKIMAELDQLQEQIPSVESDLIDPEVAEKLNSTLPKAEGSEPKASASAPAPKAADPTSGGKAEPQLNLGGEASTGKPEPKLVIEESDNSDSELDLNIDLDVPTEAEADTLADFQAEASSESSLEDTLGDIKQDEIQDTTGQSILSENSDLDSEPTDQEEPSMVNNVTQLPTRESKPSSQVPASMGDGRLSMTLSGQMSLDLKYASNGQEVSVCFEQDHLLVQLSGGVEVRIPLQASQENRKAG